MRCRLACAQKLRRRGDFQLSSIFGYGGDDSGKFLALFGIIPPLSAALVRRRGIARVKRLPRP
jgi:hypothetical protein